MLQRSVALGIVAVGQTVVILAGSLDLSVAYLISLASLVAAETMDGERRHDPAGDRRRARCSASVVGLVNGLIITKLRVNAFIATLGIGADHQGRTSTTATTARPARSRRASSSSATRASAPIPVSVFLLLAVVAASVWFLLRYTRFGYHLYAVGGDEEVGPALRRPHAPHDHRRARPLLALRGAHRPVPRQPARRGHADRRHRRRLRPGVDRRGGARRHGAGRRPRRRARHGRRRAASSPCSTTSSTSSRSTRSSRTSCAA